MNCWSEVLSRIVPYSSESWKYSTHGTALYRIKPSSEIHCRPLDYIVVDNMALLEIGATIAFTQVRGGWRKTQFGQLAG